MEGIGSSSWVTQAIHDRGITRLCHFTSIQALEGIVNDRALLDRQTLSDRGRRFTFNDPYRHDGRLTHVCLTVEHPNIIMMNRLNKNTTSSREFVVVCIRPSEMAREGVLFSKLNAATDSGGLLTPGDAGLRSLYQPRPGPKPISRGASHAESCPTDIQAEVLVPGPVSLSNALGIVTSSEESNVRVRRLLATEGLNLPTIVQPRFFSYADITSSVWSGKVVDLPGL